MQTKSEIRAYISEIKKSMSDTDIASLSEAIINQLITTDCRNIKADSGSTT